MQNFDLTEILLMLAVIFIAILFIKFLLKTVIKFAVTIVLMFAIQGMMPSIMPHVLPYVHSLFDFGDHAWIWEPIIAYLLPFVIAGVLASFLWSLIARIPRLISRFFKKILFIK